MTKKVSQDQWFNGEAIIQGNFNKGNLKGSKGQVVVELQKTFKGDERFKLDSRFQDDIVQEKLDRKFRDLNSELLKEIEVDEVEDEQLDHKEEVDRQLNILTKIMPDERAFISYQKKPDKKSYNLIHARFDPTQIDKKLFKKKESKEVQKKVEKVKIEKGVDKKQLNIQKADALLKKTLDREAPTVVKKLKIEGQAWKNVISEEKQTFTLFS